MKGPVKIRKSMTTIKGKGDEGYQVRWLWKLLPRQGIVSPQRQETCKKELSDKWVNSDEKM